MRSPRRRLGFERAGKVPAARLGLPARRARTLTLVQSWVAVAGADLARHAVATGIARGVLEIEAEDQRWHDAVAPLLPQLAARLAVEQPTLGVKKFRLTLAGAPDAVPAVLVPEYEGDLSASPTSTRDRSARARPTPAPSSLPVPSGEDLVRRLEGLAGRYLRRGKDQKA